ncbi:MULTISPECIES: glycosyltransferase [unclassified Neisseria]|uniref:glycosyltransferase n=1 Tax=unclassified Neisseria TaxID=2623750 RepID=UPI0026662EF6|nr:MULTISPECIES: glycosyltransferase [unclassified Neisseria]MDO1509874.1 glycosyltransferase [Neisseria sp. MVDL19-042950]MDO1516072.1 glycosyltransferase [Neisseria sp. MVDL18-041461]MDO1563187.1 glycosyltransferase [Neisseria sp. MVDL20-010259]
MEKILSQAIACYNNQNFQDALLLFKQASNIYGEKIVSLHIKKCNEALKKIAPLSQEAKAICASNEVQNNILPALDTLDIATKILLNNQGLLELSESERADSVKAWKQLTQRKSEDAEYKKVNPIPSNWPKNLQLAPLPEGPNDYLWLEKRSGYNHIASTSIKNSNIGLSIIIPTFNRDWILDITLACLVNQKTNYAFEVIVADDGSQQQIVDVVRKYENILDIKYVRQPDNGYQLCATRNLGLRTAKYDYVSILDCDMAPNPHWVQSYLHRLLQNDNVALVGPRKYVDTHGLSAKDFLANDQLITNLPETKTNNLVGSTQTAVASIDWRLEHFAKTDNLRLCDSPFRYFSGGNVAFARKWLDIAGWFDEEFTHWGGEDNEFGYRLFKKGCFFQSLDGGMAYHQEPPGKENETDRSEGKKITINIVKEKVPYFYRKPTSLLSDTIHKVPLVSIYIPAYNCSSYIVRCVDSALNQTITDLEVCICDDGSTDNTLEVLHRHYGNNPRVRIMTKKNGGIASASNAAVKMARGFYIGQLDSDDYLEPDAVELCLSEFLKNRKLACVYTTNRNVNPDGSLIAKGYNWPEFSREKLTTAMIVHHFRMFSARAWYLTEGFDETITNAVDYDIYLKLSEVGEFKHINKICYNRVLHGENTSIKKLGLQKINHFKVVNASLKRQAKLSYEYAPEDTDDASRKYVFKLTLEQ